MKISLSSTEVNAVINFVQTMAGNVESANAINVALKKPFIKMSYDDMEINSFEDIMYAVNMEQEDPTEHGITLEIDRIVIPKLVNDSTPHLAAIYNLGKTFGFMFHTFTESLNTTMKDINKYCEKRNNGSIIKVTLKKSRKAGE